MTKTRRIISNVHVTETNYKKKVKTLETQTFSKLLIALSILIEKPAKYRIQ